MPGIKYLATRIERWGSDIRPNGEDGHDILVLRA